MDNSNNIKVVCRFRPQNSHELEYNGKINIQFDEEMIGVKLENRESSFIFDKVFDWNNTQHDFFNYSACSIVEGKFISIEVRNFNLMYV
jgi:kinesin family protein 5